MNYGGNYGAWFPNKSTNVWVKYHGPESDEFAGMQCWRINKLDAIVGNGAISFLHATRQVDLINQNEITLMSSAAEFGPGFYTTCGNDLEGSKTLGAYWYEDESKNKKVKNDWVILRFVIDAPVASMKKLYGSSKYKQEVEFFLTTPNGYPSGQAQPTSGDLTIINAINKEGRVLIFPDDKDIKVQYGKGSKQLSWNDFVGKGGDEPYLVIVGPQKPTKLTMRQQCWRYPAGIWLINSARRHLAYTRT